MPGVHRKIEIVGTSAVSSSDAVKQAVAEASKTIQHMEWFEVKEVRGRIRGGEVAEFQVTILIGYKL
jgi:hypothetical protein